MEKVLGLGGFFFRAADPAALAKWYEDMLGINPVPTAAGQDSWVQEAGETAFAPFAADTTYFGDKRYQFMLNFRVADLHAMVRQLEAGGTAVEVDPETYPMGIFANLTDPEGNPIQLWQPM